MLYKFKNLIFSIIKQLYRFIEFRCYKIHMNRNSKNLLRKEIK